MLQQLENAEATIVLNMSHADLVLGLLPSTQYEISARTGADVHSVNGLLDRMRRNKMVKKTRNTVNFPNSKFPSRQHSIWVRAE